MYHELFQRSKNDGNAASSTPQQEDSDSGTAPTERNGSTAEKAGKTEATPESKDAQAGLVALAKSSVDGFFELLQAKVDHSLNSRRRPRAESGASDSAAVGGGCGEEGAVGEEEGDNLDGVALGGVVAAVQQLVSDMEAVDPHVPQVFLAKRAKEFAQEFKRSQVCCVCMGIQTVHHVFDVQSQHSVIP